jgi:hypothetical protein
MSVPPQPSPAGPQSTPSPVHVFGTQAEPHWLGVPAPPQVWGVGHVPHMSIPPQPSPVVPQPTPSAAQVVGVQVDASVWPQTLGLPPPPHVSAPVHVPHWSIPPQPSDCAPQLKPSLAHVVGTQATLPHWLGVPPPPHV